MPSEILALSGILMVQTASIYRLSRLSGFQVPIEPLVDLVPGISPNRVTMDMIDSEDLESNYTVTQNALQDFSNATTNVHRELRRITVTGVMTSIFQFPLGGGSAGFPGSRLDLLRIMNLENIADRKEPVMVVTPRFSLPRCFIERISRPWSPDIGQNVQVTISCVEARIVSRMVGAQVPDYEGQTPGKNAESGGGLESGTETSNVSFGTAGLALGVAPV